jgi:pimeloyl-ACP methyl ester carboxylesterase
MKNKKALTKKPNKFLAVLKWIGIGIASLLILGFLYEHISELIDSKTLKIPGQTIQVGDHKMHIYCTGENKNGSPTVILIAGAGGLWTSWDRVQPEIAKETKVCSYDRSGLGFSDNNRKNDYSSAFAANELKQLLVASNIQAPYVVVGHSWGGKIARIFAHDNKESSRG